MNVARRFVVTMMIAIPAGPAAAEPLFHTTMVFSAYPGNRPNYRIPALVQAPNSDLLIFVEKRNDGIGDVGNHDLVMKRSSDLGRTWGPDELILDQGENTCTDSTPFVDRASGKLFLFFLENKKRYAYLLSTDSGRSWHGPVSIHEQVTRPEWDRLGQSSAPAGPQVADPASGSKGTAWASGYFQRYGVGPGSGVVRLTRGPQRGRIIVPARHREQVGVGQQYASFPHVFFSDDGGETWQLGGTVGKHGSESHLVELENGDVMINMRDENPEDTPDNIRRLVSISRDGGETWSPIRRDETLFEPRCHAAIERLTSSATGGRSRILFSNPASPIRQEAHPYGRYNLSVRLSYDEGQTWTAGKTIHPHPSSYSDLTVLDDMTVGLVYERGPKGTVRYWDEIHFARFNLEWLTVGRDAVKRGTRSRNRRSGAGPKADDRRSR